MIRMSGLVREFGNLANGQLSPEDPRVAYLPPEQGPFACDHCEYYISGKARCHKVSGYIDPHGCCNLYHKDEKHFQQGLDAHEPHTEK